MTGLPASRSSGPACSVAAGDTACGCGPRARHVRRPAMSVRRNGKTAAKPEARQAEDPRELAAELKGDPRRSGSKSGEFTLILLNQAVQAAFYGRDPQEGFADLQQAAIMAVLKGIAPRDPLEGMLAAQLVSVHNGVMDCLRRAQHPDQTFA